MHSRPDIPDTSRTGNGGWIRPLRQDARNGQLTTSVRVNGRLSRRGQPPFSPTRLPLYYSPGTFGVLSASGAFGAEFDDDVVLDRAVSDPL
ncbi:hypothetical protein ABT168_19785 [Streptomyces sp. NPDC001793]|uniref:hypothetical protein n=1 Tax=Streptomyces sp. NPDC001793 TaxID=3154657 RepID=UPI0033208874